jgi:hypothetical protein
MQQLIEELNKVSREIRAIEAEARTALFDRNDDSVYRKNLQEKTSLLMDLPRRTEPFLGCLEGHARKKIEPGLKDFARRASQANSVSSVFYMAGLLYPDDYREGEPNDLEKFIENLRKEHLASV